MAFTVVTDGDRIRASHLTEIQDALQGVSGNGVAISLTQISDSTYYALDVRNLDSTNGRVLRARDESSNTILDATRTGLTIGKKVTLTGGAYTAAADLLSATATWNAAAATFNGIKLVVTNTASAAASRLLDLQTATGSKFSVDTSGNVIAAGTTTLTGLLNANAGIAVDTSAFTVANTTGAIAVSTGALTAGISVLSLTSTWNALADTFYGVKLVVTDTASSITSRLLDLQLSTGSVFNVDKSGNVIAGGGITLYDIAYINDTANAKMTLGLTINQGVNDDEILSFKSSDVSHEVTSITETDTYGYIQKYNTVGGLILGGLEDTGGSGVGLVGYGITATAVQTAKSTVARGVVMLIGASVSGPDVADVGANGNILIVRNNATTRFILDGDGDSHQDVGTAWTNFDQYDDVALLNVLAAEVARPDDPIKDEFRDWLVYNRADLERAKLVTFNDDNHHFVNMSRLAWLLVGAARQAGSRIRHLEETVSTLKLVEQILLEARQAG